MINEILKYPDDCAGSIMTTEYVSLRPNMTAGEAIQRIRCTGVDKETIYTCYVTENNRKLVGMVSLRTLLFSEDEDVLENIMESNVISVNTLEDQESVAQMFTKYDFAALPVVDQENRLVGIITVDDAIDVLQEETTEDFEKMAGMAPSDKPYLRTGVFETWKSRVPWLLILMLPDRLYSHADGHRGQQRYPGFGGGDPRPVSGGSGIFRHLPGGLEGDPGGGSLRRDLGGL